MGTMTPAELLQLWAQDHLTPEMAIGHPSILGGYCSMRSPVVEGVRLLSQKVGEARRRGLTACTSAATKARSTRRFMDEIYSIPI